MARQRSIIPFTGKLGDQIGFERDGKYFFRSAPQHIRQTNATRRASRRFGRCSRKGRLIRHVCYPELDVRCDSTHVNRLNKCLIEAGGDHTALTGFRFNEQVGIDRFFTKNPGYVQNGTWHIPAQDIPQCAHFTALELKVIAVRIDFNTNRVTGTDAVTLMIDAQEHFPGTDIPLYVAGEGTLILTVQVRGIRSDGPSCNKQYQAADIVAVIVPPHPKRFKVHAHPQAISTEGIADSLPSQEHIHQLIIQRE